MSLLNPAKKFRYISLLQPDSILLNFQNHILYPQTFESNTFTFLNKSVRFDKEIDWAYSEHGLLWTYNLNYFDFLNQEVVDIDDCVSIINDFIRTLDTNKIGWQPYPISLRIVNWIKFIIRNRTKLEIHKDFNLTLFNRTLYIQLLFLKRNIEYHLMGNHLFENGVALLFGAYYFNDMGFFSKAKRILVSEINEQILNDGAHFEQSPMYHQILLSRLLDITNLYNNNVNIFQDNLFDQLNAKTSKMLKWLKNISFSNGQIPLFNDSANGVAPGTKELFQYADELNIKTAGSPIFSLNESGFRKRKTNHYEIVLDIGSVCSGYQPAHTHSDIFNFELYLDQKPLIVDTGTSTYENNNQRKLQRSTIAHNTVTIGNIDPHQVWSSFRVANRAEVIVLEDSEELISAYHTGYRRINVEHQRTFMISDDALKIIDKLISKQCIEGVFHLHFHPSVQFKVNDNTIIGRDFRIDFENVDSLVIEEYEFAPEFNRTFSARKAKALFHVDISANFRFG